MTTFTSITSFAQSMYSLQIRFTVCDIGCYKLRHLFILYDILPFDTDNKCQLWLRWNIEITTCLCLATQSDFLMFCSTIFFDVLFGTFKNYFTGLFGCL